jgi:hypothetical protein
MFVLLGNTLNASFLQENLESLIDGTRGQIVPSIRDSLRKWGRVPVPTSRMPIFPLSLI